MSEAAASPPKEVEPSSARLAGTLALAGLFSGLLLVGAYELTLPTIQANEARALKEAVLRVVPRAASMSRLVLVDGALQAAEEGDERPGIYAASDESGAVLGYAIPAEGPGFQDTIRLLYGFDARRRVVTGMEVLDSRETPGLGDKIYKDASFVGNFAALAVDPTILVVKSGTRQAPNEVDAITGATISSKAVVKMINAANARWLPLLPGERAEGGS